MPFVSCRMREILSKIRLSVWASDLQDALTHAATHRPKSPPVHESQGNVEPPPPEKFKLN
ncbi:hypothetical protein K438DRAFT_1883352 [Mycena galopus ATCC 62051]|nr:hypothetical protein K438DRAFT_1883352 [Mycena galopus ATCC 62051]